MPFYKIAEMQQNPSTANPQQFVQTAVGEFMKAGIVTKPDEEGPPLVYPTVEAALAAATQERATEEPPSGA